MISALAFLLVVLLAAGILCWLVARLPKTLNRRIESQIRGEFASMEGRLKEDVGRFIQSENDRFIHEQTKSKAVLEQNRQAIEMQVDHLNKELDQVVRLIQEFEKDRAGRFASLDQRITQTVTATQNLSEATAKLNSIIGNNQLRGQWGQRMAEDILRAAGLEEGVQYHKEKSQETVGTRPDYIFSLPDGHKIYMDVKFPLNNYQALMQAEEKPDQDRYAQEFIRDVKNRLRELKKREYVNPEERTLDYLILFIPNEQIFGFIHRLAPEIMDEALEQKVLLTSPYSLFGVLSIIRQAYDNFHFKKSAGEILKLIGQFLDDYKIFKKRFADLGALLDKSKEKYLEVSETSFKRLDQRIQKLEDFRRGQEGAVLPAAPEDSDPQFILQ